MNISEAAKVSGLSAQTVRYYEAIGLIQPARQIRNGYRSFSQLDLHRLCFLKQAKTTGFSLEESRDLLALYENTERRSEHVKQLVMDKVSRLDQQIEELLSMRKTLSELAEGCKGDEQPNCHIINRLAERGEGNE